MTKKEAEELAKIFATTDGVCLYCIKNICEEANRRKLGFHWWPKGYNSELRIQVQVYDGDTDNPNLEKFITN